MEGKCDCDCVCVKMPVVWSQSKRTVSICVPKWLDFPIK